MRKEDDFLIYCMERYRYYKNLSGKDVAKLFEKHGVYSYIKQYFESLHTMGDYYIVQDIDDYIRDTQLHFQAHKINNNILLYHMEMF